MKTFRDSNLIYVVFTDKESDDEIYELELLNIEENDSEEAVLVTNVGRMKVDSQYLDFQEMHYDTGIHLFTDRSLAENWKINAEK